MTRFLSATLFVIIILPNMAIRYAAGENEVACQALVKPRIAIEKKTIFNVRGFSKCSRYLLCERISAELWQGDIDFESWQAVLVSLGLKERETIGSLDPLAEQKPIWLLPSMPEFLGVSAISPSTGVMVIATVDELGTKVQFLEIGSKKPITTDIYKGEGVAMMEFSPDGKILVIALAREHDQNKLPDHRLVVYNTDNPEAPKVESSFFIPCRSRLGLSFLAAFPGRREVLVGWKNPFEYDQRALHVYSFDGDPLFTYEEDERPRLTAEDLLNITNVRVSSTGCQTALVYRDGKIRLYNSQKADEFKRGSRVLRYPSAFYQEGAFAPDERWFFVGGLEFDPPDQDETGYGVVHVWDLKERRLVARYRVSNERVVSLAVSPDGRWLAVSDSSGRLQVLELPKQFHKTP